MDMHIWVNDCINGSRGLREFIKYENLGVEPDDIAVDAAEWVLRCLVQPESHMFLAAVNAEAAKRKDGAA